MKEDNEIKEGYDTRLKIFSEDPIKFHKTENTDYLDLEASIEISRNHNSAHRINQIIEEKFDQKPHKSCQCCGLILQDQDTAKPFSCCYGANDLGDHYISVKLYLLFLQFCIISLLIVAGMSSVCQLYVSYLTYNDISAFCMNSNNFIFNDCNIYRQFNETYLFSMSYNNLKHFYNISGTIYSNYNVLNSADLGFTAFLAMCVILTVNYLYMIIARNYVIQYNISKISPSNFTLMISNLKLDCDDSLNLIRDLTTERISPVSVNFTYNLRKYCDLKENFEKLQSKINWCNLNNLNLYETASCCLCCDGCLEGSFCNFSFCDSQINISSIINQRNSVKKQMEENLESLKNKDNFKFHFSGVVFATFETEKQANNYFKMYPKSVQGYIVTILRYIGTNLLFFWCFSDRTKKNNRNRVFFQVVLAGEPEEIIWQNLGYSKIERFFRRSIILILSLIFSGIAFVIMYGLNLAQRSLNPTKDQGVNYLISFIFASLAEFINYLQNLLILTFTDFEKHDNINDLYISHSFNTVVLGFINSGVIPLVVNYITGNFNDHPEILYNNLLIIFGLNSILYPLSVMCQLFHCFKVCTRNSISKKHRNGGFIKLNQKELNEVYENPNIEFSNKFSYLGKTVIMAFFFIPLFPEGTFFAIFSVFFLYLIERYNIIRLYKTPEMLNEKLSLAYFHYFKWSLFFYSLSIILFYNVTYLTWSIINIVVFSTVLFIPFHDFLIPDMITITDLHSTKENYSDVYLDFHTDYERTNPLTKKDGFKKYFTELFNSGEISSDEYKMISKELDMKENEYIDDFFSKTYNFEKFRKSYEERYFTKMINQAFIDNCYKTPQSEDFTDRFYLENIIQNNIFSARKNRHNKKIELKSKIYKRNQNSLKSPKKTPLEAHEDNQNNESLNDKNFKIQNEKPIDMMNNNDDYNEKDSVNFKKGSF